MSENAMADTPFNHKQCDLPGYESFWVRFKTSGYPRKLRREWDEANTADKTLGIVLRYVAGLGLKDLDGNEIPLTDDVRAFDNVEELLCVWMVREFQKFWLFELPSPRKN